MKKRYKILLFLLVMAACGAGAFYYLSQPLEVETESVTRGPLVEQITEQGTVSPGRSYTLNADLSGTVGELLFGEGESIAEGEALLELDSSRARRELESQIASLGLQKSAIYSDSSGSKAELELRREQLRGQITAAKQEYERLFGKEGISRPLRNIAQDNYLQARRAYREARDYYDDFYYDEDDEDYRGYTIGDSGLSALRTQMSVAQENLVIAQGNDSPTTKAYYEEIIASSEAQLAALGENDTYSGNSTYAAAQQLQLTIGTLQEKLGAPPVTAPADGVVWSILVEEGEFVVENQPLVSIYTPEGMCVEARMLAEDALSLKVGDTARCQFADGTIIAPKISFISPVAEEVYSTIGLAESRCTVRLEPGRLPGAIGAGHQAKLTFSVPIAEDALSVSAGSIVPWEGGSAVYLIREGSAIISPVEVGTRRGGRVEILSGLAEGDIIVGNPYDSKVSDKAAVTGAGLEQPAASSGEAAKK